MAELNPLDWLAIAQVVQSEAQRKKVAPQEEYERGLVGQRLTPFGGNIADYQKEWQAGYNPQAALSEAMAKSRGEYWSGLSDVMLRAAKEGLATGGKKPDVQPESPQYTNAQLALAVYGPNALSRGSTAYDGPTREANRSTTADTMARRAGASAAQARRIRTNVMPARFGR